MAQFAAAAAPEFLYFFSALHTHKANSVLYIKKSTREGEKDETAEKLEDPRWKLERIMRRQNFISRRLRFYQVCRSKLGVTERIREAANPVKSSTNTSLVPNC